MQEKLEKLKNHINSLNKLAVAFSGGVDSTFLLKVCHDVLEENVLAIIVLFSVYIESEIEDALNFVKKNNINYEIIKIDEFSINGYVKNGKNRCYHCKKYLFENMLKLAKKKGYDILVEGSNLDDLNDYRPGIKALSELKVLSPLRESNLRKSEIREISRQMGLAKWDKPTMACLASRIPYGDRVKKEDLVMVKKAEEILKKLGFKQWRVRKHGILARVELFEDDMILAIEKKFKSEIIDKFKRIGFKYVTLDLDGYITGSLNRELIN